MLDVLKILQEYQEAAGYYPPSDEIRAALDIDLPDSLLEDIGEFEARKVDAEQDMVHGALQIAASRLLGQRNQENAGHKEMFEGFSALKNLREERAKAYAKEIREATQRAKPKRRSGRKATRKSSKD
jgi:hypothetical protein